jgi:hypothetical protein
MFSAVYSDYKKRRINGIIEKVKLMTAVTYYSHYIAILDKQSITGDS